jgi:hypothetical protein
MNAHTSVYSNVNSIGLALAVWLAHDDYDNGANQHPGQNVISATGLLKSTRSLILANRIPPQDRQADLSERISSRLGHAIHDSIEAAWRKGYREALALIGYPRQVIERVRINPEDHELDANPDIFPVYLEQRYFREIEVDGQIIVISGKFDQIINGELNDTKTTSVYTWIKGSKMEDYRIQGSIYRWINPDKVTSDVMRIQHVFTDWQGAMAKRDTSYPSSRVVEAQVPLMTLGETQAWIRNKLREIISNQGRQEPDIVHCTDEELWMSEPQFKYYADPAKAAEGGRSTKNFPNMPAAAAWRNKQGKGIVITVPGEPKACRYCPAFDLCTQKDAYFTNIPDDEDATDD